MQYRTLGKSNVKVTRITFGAWAIGGWMWGGQDDADAIEAIKASLDAGVTTIDTAAIYGFGHSEELVAKAIAGKRDKVQILTKYGLRWDSDEGPVKWETRDNDGKPVAVRHNSTKKGVLLECERSLKRLNTDYIDLYQCHRRDETTPIEETMSAIDKLLKDGKILAAGVSNFTVDELDAACKVVPIAAHQPPYSMVNRDIEKDLVPYCMKHNVGIIVYSPLQRGMLTGKITEDYKFKPGDHRADNPFFKIENRRRVNKFLDEIRPIADAHKATLAQLVINWTIHRPGITAALVGARDARQARENAAAANFELSAEETKKINDVLENLKLEL